jgi:two-component system OmpR family sensor kinase
MRAVGELGLVGAAAVLVVGISRSPRFQDAVPAAETSIALALVSAACAVAAAVLAAFLHRLFNDARAARIGAASALYGLVGVPATSIGAAFEPAQAAIGAARLTTHVLVVMMLVASVRSPSRGPSSRAVPLLPLSLLCTLAMGLLATLAPEPARMVTNFQPLRFAVVGVWLLAGLALAVLGLIDRSSSLSRVGLGVAVVALAHAYRVDTEPAQPIIQPGLTFSLLRVLGVVLILVGLIQLARTAFLTVDECASERQEQLRRARIRLDLVAEREHDLHDGLVGLAGVAHLVGGLPLAEEMRTLRWAVTAELARLEAMLQGSGREVAEPGRSYPPEPVILEVVALRRGDGMDIRCDVEPGR